MNSWNGTQRSPLPSRVIEGGIYFFRLFVIKEGDKVPFVLRFQNAGEVKTELEVKPLVGAASKGHSH